MQRGHRGGHWAMQDRNHQRICSGKDKSFCMWPRILQFFPGGDQLALYLTRLFCGTGGSCVLIIICNTTAYYRLMIFKCSFHCLYKNTIIPEPLQVLWHVDRGGFKCGQTTEQNLAPECQPTWAVKLAPWKESQEAKRAWESECWGSDPSAASFL